MRTPRPRSAVRATPEDVSDRGGPGCFFEFLGGCYSTGTRSYKVVAAAPLEIDFAADVNTLELFFANEVAGVSGTMRFYDIDGYEVDSPITTNGVCSGAVMPPAQMLACSRSVRRIEVVATGVGDVWIDTLTVNPWRARLGDRRGDRSAEDVGPAKPIAYASFSREVCLPLTLSAVCGETPAVQKVSYSYISHGIVRAAQ